MKIKIYILALEMALALGAVRHASAQTWTPTSAPLGPWTTIASSADGLKLVAAGHGSQGMGDPLVPTPWWIFTSVNGGENWAPASAPSQPWTSVAASADGNLMVAASTIRGIWNQDWGSAFGTIFRSEDSGVTWTQACAPTNSWSAITCSADGKKLAAVTGNPRGYSFTPSFGLIWVSTDSGKTWRPTDTPTNNWSAIASSGDGTRLVAASVESATIEGASTGLGSIYTSADSGTNWVRTAAPTDLWIAVASSADGVWLVAASSDGLIYQSTNSGATWTPTTAPEDSWNGLVSSADGLKLMATGFLRRSIRIE